MQRLSTTLQLAIAIAVVFLFAPVAANAQQSGVGVVVSGAVGTDVRAHGNNQSLSVGVALGDHVELLATAERIQAARPNSSAANFAGCPWAAAASHRTSLPELAAGPRVRT